MKVILFHFNYMYLIVSDVSGHLLRVNARDSL